MTGRLLRHGLAAAVLLWGAAAGSAAPLDDVLGVPLACRFQAVSLGQFHGLDYGPGVPSGSSGVVVAASPADLKQGRAALVEGASASAARILDTGKQVLLVATGPNGSVMMLTMFTVAGADRAYPAALVRQTVIGSTPVLVQSTGSCRSDPQAR